MPIQQEVELLLKAKMDSEGVQTQAAQLAQELAQAFERAFETSQQRVLSRGSGIINPQGGFYPSSQTPGQGAGGPISSVGLNAGPQGGGGAQSAFHSFTPGYIPNMSGFPNESISNMMRQDVTGVAGSSASYPNFLADMMGSQARSMVQAKRAGVNVNVNDEEKQAFREALDISRSNIEGAIRQQQGDTEAIRALQDAIEILTDELGTATEAQKKSNELDIEQKQSQLNQMKEVQAARADSLSAAINANVRNAQAINEVMGSGGGMFGQYAGTVAGGAGIAYTMASLPGAYRRASASMAQVGNFEARAALSGDIDTGIATERLGGQGEVTGKATVEEIIKSAAIGIGSLAAGAMLAPMTGGLSLLGSAAGAAYGIARVPGAISGNIEEQIASEQGTNRELYDVNRAGREFYRGRFRTAQGMGGAELTPFLTGESGGLMRTGVGQYNLGQEAVLNTLQSLAGSMGTGVLNNPAAFGRLLRTQSMGFGQAGEAAGALFQGGGPGSSPEATIDVLIRAFEGAVSSGLDKAQAGRAILNMSQRAAARGMGGAEIEMGIMGGAGAMARGMFGDRYNERELEAVRSPYEKLRGATTGAAGIGAIAGFQGADKGLRALLGDKYDQLTENQKEDMRIQIQASRVDAAGLKSMLEEQKIDSAGMNLSKGASVIESEKATALLEMRQGGLPPGLGDTLTALDISGRGGTLSNLQAAKGVIRRTRAGQDEAGEVFGMQGPATDDRSETIRKMELIGIEKTITGLGTFGETVGSVTTVLEKLRDRLNEVIANEYFNKHISRGYAPEE